MKTKLQLPTEVIKIDLPIKGEFVYFLCDDETILYIGITNNLFARIGEHSRANKIPFTHIFFHIVDSRKEALTLENKYINSYQPWHNINVNNNYKQQNRNNKQPKCYYGSDGNKQILIFAKNNKSRMIFFPKYFFYFFKIGNHEPKMRGGGGG